MFEKMLSREGINGIEILSAGTITTGGERVAQATLEMASQIGLDLSGHNSTPIDPELLRSSNLILVMEEIHRVSILGMCPDVADRVKLLRTYTSHSGPDEGIPDPGGLPPLAFRSCFALIMESLEGLIKTLKEENGSVKNSR
jgi:protein-tyrosine-phosphatase